MRCIICHKTEEETDLSEGIFEGEIVKICENCAKQEEIPIIRKPSEEQLQKADERYSVRERMEKLSNIRHGAVGKDNEIALKNLAKLKIPKKPKQQPESLVDNYHWRMQISRRRKKISLSQLSQQTGIPLETIQEIEDAQLPENYAPILKILEEVLDVSLFKKPPKKLIFHIPEKSSEQKQKQIIEQTREKIKQSGEIEKAKKEIVTKIAKGRFDFSKKEDLEKITLNDLIEMKRKREKVVRERKENKQHKDMFGDDLEIEED